MLANILAYCSSGMEKFIMFQSSTCFCSVCRSPCGFYWGTKSLAARADKLWATHKQQSHSLVAKMDMAEEQPEADQKK